MTFLQDDDDRPDPAGGTGRSSLGLGLNLVGVVVVAFWLVVNGVRLDTPAWVYVVSGIALAAWAVRQLSRRPGLIVPASIVMLLAGAVAAQPTQSLLIVPSIIGVVQLGSDRRIPIWAGAVAAIVGEVVIAGSTAIRGGSVDFVFGTAAGLLLGVLIGVSRRQFREAEARRRQAEDEQQRAELAADRARAARDVHDVLAHSLGGLVLQLDAVEALLEAGRTDEATSRASDARALAVDGLAEARRAVAALRDPEDAGPARTPGATTAADPHRASSPADEDATPDGDATADISATPDDAPDRSGLAALVAAHRSFGGSIAVQGDLDLADLDDAHAAAVVAAAREALSNARRHAAGSGVSLSIIRDGDAVDVVVANPLATGGHGLVGMRERFAELGDGSTIEAERSDGEFVVAMHVVAVADPEPAATEPVGRTPVEQGPA